AAATDEIARTCDADRGEERLVAGKHVSARVETEHLQLGARLFRDREFRQAADGRLVRRIAEFQRKLHVHRFDFRSSLRLRLRELPHGQCLLDTFFLASLGRTGATRCSTCPSVQIRDLQEQVTSRDLASALDRQCETDAVDRVKPTGKHEPFDYRAGHVGAMPEVREGTIGPTGDDARDLLLVDAFDISKCKSDSVTLAVCPFLLGTEPSGFGLLAQDGRWWFVVLSKLLDRVG